MNSARTTPFGLLLSGGALIMFGSFMGTANFYLNAFPPIWAWMIITLGVAMVIVAFVWGSNPGEETKRKLMAMPMATRRMYWPFLKKLQFFPDNELHEEIERLKTVHDTRFIPPPRDEAKAKRKEKEEAFIPPLQD